MGEFISGISKEARQVKSALSTGKDIFWGLRKEQHKPNMVQSIALMGFSALIPEQVKASGILRNPPRMAAINALEQYMVALNDRIDFEGSGRQDLTDLINSIRDQEISRKEVMNQSFDVLPTPEQELVRRNSEIAISEVEFVEAWIRDKQDTGNISLSDVDTYRSTVNAICEVTGASIIFGPENLQDRVKPVDGEKTIQAIIDKYAWISGRHPRNETERAMMVAHNMAAAMQIVDDWKGVDIDQLLRVPTYAVAALRVSAGKKRLARALLNSKEREYREKAEELGAGKITAEALYKVYSLGQDAHNWIAKTGRRHRLARRVFEKRHLGLREAEYMKGKI